MTLNARATDKGSESKDDNIHSIHPLKMSCHVTEYDISNMA
jgi:hypothetical protein